MGIGEWLCCWVSGGIGKSWLEAALVGFSHESHAWFLFITFPPHPGPLPQGEGVRFTVEWLVGAVSDIVSVCSLSR